MNRIAALIVAFCFFVVGGSTMADESSRSTPAIKHAGRIHPVPQSAYQPGSEATYKAVFWLTKGADKPDQLNPALDRLARTVNLYISAGVPLNHLKFIAVVSGPATPIVLDDTHYRKQYDTANPNLALIEELRQAGVDIAVCGQAVAGHHYRYGWIDSHVKLAPSASIVTIDFQQKGYALVP